MAIEHPYTVPCDDSISPRPDQDGIMEALKQRYRIEDESSVGSFLEKYPQLCRPLLDGAYEIRRIFEASPLGLHVENYDQETLYIVIETDLPVKEAGDLEEKLSLSWFVHLPRIVQDKLSITARGGPQY